MNRRPGDSYSSARNQLRPVALLVFLLATFGSAAYPPLAEALTFTDDFNRPDSAMVGNGWLDSPSNVGGNLSIRSGLLTTVGNFSIAGIYRPFPFTTPVTMTATLAETSGFGGLLRAHNALVGIRSDGTLNSGYVLSFHRSDINFNNSTITLKDGAAVIASFTPSIQLRFHRLRHHVQCGWQHRRHDRPERSE